MTNTEPFMYVITLVHGTFARDSEWPRSGSEYCTSLVEHLEVAGPVKFESVEWTGKNSHAARLEAGGRVRESLLTSLALHPQSRHFVVAHSHGGTATLYALRDPTLAAKMCGVVTMGSPFIRCKPRDITASFRWLQWTIPGLLVFGTMMVIAALAVAYEDALNTWESQTLGTTEPRAWEMAIALLLAVSCISVWASARRLVVLRIWPSVLQRSEATLARLEWPSHEWAAPLLCLRARWDEAAVGLAAQYTIGRLPFVFWRRATLPVLGLVLWCALLASQFEPDESLVLQAGASGCVALFAVALLHLGWLMLMAFFPLARAHRFAFGGETILDNWFTDISFNSDPPGSWPTLSLPELFTRTTEGTLNHSVFYQQDDVIKHTARWMRARASHPSARLEAGASMQANEQIEQRS